MRALLIAVMILLCHRGNAQLFDTLRLLFDRKYSIDARLESRNSFINNQLISVNGVRLGLTFQRKFRLGGGISWLDSPYKLERSSINSLGAWQPETRFMKFVYLCYYLDFVFYKTKRWQLSVPIQAGTGFSWFQQRSDYYFGNPDRKSLLLLYEPGITAQFKFFKWFGVGTDIAYRFVLRNNRRTADQLNSPTYSFKILFWFDYLFYELFPRSVISQKFGPAVW